MYKFFFKPIIDFSISTIIFIILLPVFFIFTILLLFANSGKPFFVQQRVGKNDKIFKLLKFKTMNDKKDQDGKLLSDEKRLTTVGKFIRKSSIDELPQLVNVIKGDMSLIGPRPLLVEYLKHYNKTQNISFLLDFKIIFLTIKKVFKSEGISSDTSVTMEKFEGTK